MQFTVLIEFLVPGLLTTLLFLALLPCDAVPRLPQGVPTGDTVTALLLLAVSYPVGILVNFPIFWFQKNFLTPRIHRAILKKYKAKGANLPNLISEQCNLNQPEKSSTDNHKELRDVFGLLRAAVFGKNIDRLNANHLYHEGLQRFARGMPLPLLLAAFLVWREQGSMWEWLVAGLGILLLIALWLLRYSLRAEEEQVVRFFLALVRVKPQPEPSETANPASKANG